MGDQRVGEAGEERGEFRQAAAFGEMGAVVQADADDLAGIGHRRQQAHVAKREVGVPAFRGRGDGGERVGGQRGAKAGSAPLMSRTPSSLRTPQPVTSPRAKLMSFMDLVSLAFDRAAGLRHGWFIRQAPRPRWRCRSAGTAGTGPPAAHHRLAFEQRSAEGARAALQRRVDGDDVGDERSRRDRPFG